MITESDRQTIVHEIAPVWDAGSRVLVLGTMPSPKSRGAGFFYMHAQNRFWPVLFRVFGEELKHGNADADLEKAIAERKDFLLRNGIALWDVLASCRISGAADSSIRDAVPNDFSGILSGSHIRRVFCTGKTAFALWQKHCAALYEGRFGITAECLPSTSPANARWRTDGLVREYGRILGAVRSHLSAPDIQGTAH